MVRLTYMQKNSDNIPIILEDKKVHQGPNFQKEAIEIIEHFAEKFNLHEKIRDIELHFNPIKNSVEKVKFYEIKLHVQLKNGKLLIGSSQNRDILFGIRKAIAKIKHESERSDRQKHEKYNKYY